MTIGDSSSNFLDFTSLLDVLILNCEKKKKKYAGYCEDGLSEIKHSLFFVVVLLIVEWETIPVVCF